MIDSSSKISIQKQYSLLSISRSSYYYSSKGENSLNLSLMQLIDKQHLETPFYGSRQMAQASEASHV